MFIPEASLRLYPLPQKRKTRRRKGCLSFVYTSALALFIDCALYLKIRQGSFVHCAKYGLCEAKRASQPQFKSVSNPPWPSTTNPLETPVNHPPQFIRISKYNLHPSPDQLASFFFPVQDPFLLFLFVLRLRWSLWTMKLR